MQKSAYYGRRNENQEEIFRIPERKEIKKKKILNLLLSQFRGAKTGLV
jgi:hypothetical protein